MKLTIMILSAMIQDAITEARSLDCNTDPLVDGLLTPALVHAKKMDEANQAMACLHAALHRIGHECFNSAQGSLLPDANQRLKWAQQAREAANNANMLLQGIEIVPPVIVDGAGADSLKQKEELKVQLENAHWSIRHLRAQLMAACTHLTMLADPKDNGVGDFVVECGKLIDDTDPLKKSPQKAERAKNYGYASRKNHVSPKCGQ